MGREEKHKVRAKRHTPEQVIRKLREAEVMLGEGKTIPEVAKALEVSENTFHRWRKQYGGLKAEDAKRLKELETENRQLKQLVVDKELEKLALKELAEGKW
jgi:transposase-like protein